MISFQGKGLLCWLPVLFSFFVIPGIELFVKPESQNLSEVEEDIARKNKAYDLILYMTVFFQYGLLWFFLERINENGLSYIDIFGRVLSMGLLCGTFGINVAHELGHRVNLFEQFLAKMLLLTSLYMHFFIEHNKGHHKHVATEHDPSTAKFRQSVYAFWIQTLWGTYKSAWIIAIADAKKNNRKAAFINNEMMLFQIIQLAFVSLVFFIFGWKVMLYFISAALIGGLLLETVNYIEHYGLVRKKTSENLFERVQPHHSWNSNHVIGRLMLFELSRHSDHHYLASRKYQILRHMDGAPQMPTGYPGMIILSLLPPIWFHVMHRQMKKYHLINE
ncbi:MAG: alkane 1-monooxygenase [Chitinophagaceae bacterium]